MTDRDVPDAIDVDVDALEVTVHIAAPPETVFPYFTDPARYTQWMGSHATLEPGARRHLPRRNA